MKPITVDDVRDYQGRWNTVTAAEHAELQRTPVEVRFRQLCALFESRTLFAADPNSQVRDALVAERWARIRRHYSGR
jgi:hypothetical protein